MVKVTQAQLRARQAWPLEKKIEWSLRRIRIWHDYWEGLVYVSYSGGKDSRVLLHLVRTHYPDAPAVFCNTGLEFPEIVDVVRNTENKVILRPEIPFPKVIEEHGWPVVSKKVAKIIREMRRPKDLNPNTQRLHRTGITRSGNRSSSWKCPDKWRFLEHAPFLISEKCCDVMKKDPFKEYQKRTGRMGFVGTLAADSRMREMSYLETGCNSYHGSSQVSRPISIWNTEDIWRYIKVHDLEYCPVYDMGYTTTGCLFCAFGAHLEEQPNRFQRLQMTHPRLWRYCMEKLGLRDVLIYIGIPWRWKLVPQGSS